MKKRNFLTLFGPRMAVMGGAVDGKEKEWRTTNRKCLLD